jgi:hypothetical protein
MNLFRLKEGNPRNQKLNERASVPVALMLACFALSQSTQAVVPAPNSLALGNPMHFIEQLLGFAPDGGNGFIELVIVALPFLLISVVIRRTTAHSRR